MKKILKISLIVIGLIIILIIGNNIFLSLKHDNEISKLPDYYKKLAKECELKDSYGCCIASVYDMVGDNYKLEPKSGCPDGYQRNMLKCRDTFKWCEPVEEL